MPAQDRFLFWAQNPDAGQPGSLGRLVQIWDLAQNTIQGGYTAILGLQIFKPNRIQLESAV